MSRHSYKTDQGGKTLVTMGWDRPLQQLFLRVERLGAKSAGVVYDSLEENPGRLSVNYFREVLRGQGVTAPESLFVEVQRDRESNAGNRVVRHRDDGTFETLIEG